MKGSLLITVTGDVLIPPTGARYGRASGVRRSVSRLSNQLHVHARGDSISAKQASHLHIATVNHDRRFSAGFYRIVVSQSDTITVS